ncbi:MAG: diaminopimelate decarboxylase [Pseudomonadota bacterium]|nr:diaminopimelate decarboxylase [Pseudomonadota bacterium]QKK05146.1 MAG: diaminopimelate decarboxylase [Pseudomonadota bacterium]
MGVYHYKNSALHIEDVALSRIAADVGTPVYCYSVKQLRDNYHALSKALQAAMPEQDFLIAYACKAGSNIALMKALGDEGAGADIVSGGELERAKAAGIPAEKIVYSGVGKSRAEMAAALEYGIWQINVESVPELELLSQTAAELGKTAQIALRVNPDIHAGGHDKISTGRKHDKFGIDIEKAPEIYDYAAGLPGIEITGAAMHIGSQIAENKPFRDAFTRMAALIATLRAGGHAISRIDIGGGFGITYKDEKPMDLDSFAALVKEMIAPLGCQIILEPGRALVGNAGLLLSRVLYIKNCPSAGKIGAGERSFVIIDAAMNDLIRPTLYNAYHPLLPVREAPAGTPEHAYDIVGPVCETGDTFMTGEILPEMKRDDLAAFMVSGAYGAVMSSYYNTRALVPEVLVKGNDYAVIRKRHDVADILAMEQLPEWERS